MVVGVLLLPWHWHIPSIRLEIGRITSTENCRLDMFPPDAHLEIISCLIYIYPKSFYCIMRYRASCSAAYFEYKLLYNCDYFTSLWYLMIWVCNSISASIHLPGWPFPLNYGLRLSITLYFWFCNDSPPSDISALQYWIEYVTLGLL